MILCKAAAIYIAHTYCILASQSTLAMRQLAEITRHVDLTLCCFLYCCMQLSMQYCMRICVQYTNRMLSTLRSEGSDGSDDERKECDVLEGYNSIEDPFNSSGDEADWHK